MDEHGKFGEHEGSVRVARGDSREQLMNQFFYNIATRKGKNIDRMTEQKKGAKNVAAHRSSPWQS